MSDHAESQKALFERMHDEYERHYFDEQSMAYRRRRIYPHVFAGKDLRGKRVADLCCGSGFNSLEIRRMFPGAETVGFDVSAPAVRAYREFVGADAYEFDATSGQPPAEAGAFDFVVCFGGLHHCVADLPGAFRAIRALLGGKGELLVHEAQAGYFLNGVRKLWYRLDRHFDPSSERAVSLGELESAAGVRARRVRYGGGGLAFYLVYNSMIFRVPRMVKRVISPPLIALDGITELPQFSWWHPILMAQFEFDAPEPVASPLER